MFSKPAVYYDAIYAARGKDYAREAEQLHGLIQQHKQCKGNTLLDVGCGTGAHLRHLRNFYDVAGLDLDPDILEVARHNCPDIVFHCADMSDFNLDRRFDVIVCLFSSIGYVKTFDRLQRAVQTMGDHLNPGGLLVVEPWFPPGVLQHGGVHAAFVDQPELKIARMNVHEITANVSVLNFHYLVATPDGVEHFTERHELGLFTHDEYLAAFRVAGLEVAHDPQGLDGRGLYIGANPN